MNLTLSEILTLARAGYKASEIRELDKARAEEPEPEPKPEVKQEPETEPETEPDQGSGAEEPENTAPEPDYKTMYEEIQKKLQEAQQDNVKQQMPSEPDPESKLLDMINNFF